MKIDDQLNAVTRRVASSTASHSVILEQTFTTTLGELWAACTDPALLVRWFEPVEGELRQGGRYRLSDSSTEGTITQCEPPTSLRITWEYEGDISEVVVKMRDSGGQVTLVLEHLMADSEHWRVFGPGAAGAGWDESFFALALFLAGDPQSTPEEMAQVNATPEGKQFLLDTTAAWATAHIASGADPRAAEEASQRTRTAYGAQT
ncbi:SRPBCC domain-containing protein [Arthrobacter sp. 260]|uniref:SRPBCC domain-containing protein n=1 Tax=Arthrobacter sp. 260 TaxID=2735314 RepID=UPI001491E3D2|nr:SRPBCC domain-containing protein [Arthrobacter sp. 260]NOJ59455.1 hypothetical protein [Arthrobacter sp. 260]